MTADHPLAPLMYSYRAFGIAFSSELHCPELPVGEDRPDVTITVERAPELSFDAHAMSGFDASPGHFELRVPAVGRFTVERGERILIAPVPGADEASLRLFLLGTAVGALLHQRGALPLHGAAVYKNGRSVLILGVSGAGKSSLAAALRAYGWRLQSDDISVINLRDGRVECEAGFPRQKLWPDMLQELGDDAARYRPIRVGLEKRDVPVQDAAFHSKPEMVSAVIALGGHRGSAPILLPIDGPRRMASLKRLTFRANLRAPLDMHLAHFEIIGQLATRAQMWSLQRPRIGGSPAALAEFLLPHLESLEVAR